MSVAFILTVHAEPFAQIIDCLVSIRQHYPASPVVVLDDNPSRPDEEVVELAGLLAGCMAFYVPPSSRLKALRFGCAWWVRFFEWAEILDWQVTAKIDADTRLHRQFDLPIEHVAGTVMSKGEPNEHIQGGCQLFSRYAIRELHTEAVNNARHYADPESWKMGEADYFIQKGEISTDYMLAAMCRAAGVFWYDHPCFDCRSVLHEDAPPFRKDAAVTHPHKPTE